MSLNSAAGNDSALKAKVAALQQQHLLAYWSELTPAEQTRLARQIAEIDEGDYRQLSSASLAEGDEQATQSALAERALPPPAFRLDGSGASFSRDAARAAGQDALRGGKIGMMLVAGGLGTRLGFDQPKGMFELGPISKRTLFEMFCQQLLAIRKRYGAPIPLYVMTSPFTDSETAQFLAEHQYFGLPAADVKLFCQSTFWAMDARNKRILLESKGSLFLGPDGHGGMLAAFAKSGCLADAQQRGIEHIFYGQIDNPLLPGCDPVMIGSHLLAGSEMTTLVVPKRDPLERVGNVVQVDGKVRVIEYMHFPQAVAERRNADGSLAIWAGNLAIHVISLRFLQRMSQQADALPLHPSLKKVPHLNESGELIAPEKPNAWRFERFIFDLLPWAKNALVVEADRQTAFAPVKNSDADAIDCPSTARAALVDMHRRWIEEAGGEVAEGIDVEINPLWALDAAEVRSKLPPGTRITTPTYFVP
jgi:UDP-N-acetylglucosamine/UDP-N-acetylgalactosamine diphosphorylase